MNYYPNNTLTSYKTHFDTPLLLSEPHEAALSEIIFPAQWSNVQPDECVVILPLRTLKALREAKQSVENPRGDPRPTSYTIDWNKLSQDIDLEEVLEQVDDLTLEEREYDSDDETSEEVYGQEARNRHAFERGLPAFFPPTSLKLLDMFYSPTNIKEKIRSRAKRSADHIRRRERVRSLIPSAYAIRPIYTDDNEDFIEHINDTMKGTDIDGKSFLTASETDMFLYDRVTRKVTISVPANTIVVLSDHLANILGFGEKQYFKKNTAGVFMMDPFGDVYSVYVYTLSLIHI